MNELKAKRTAPILIICGILVLALALGATVVFAQSDEEPETPPETNLEDHAFHGGKHGFHPGDQFNFRVAGIEQIAAELGVEPEELQNAFQAAVDAAREDGILPAPFHRDAERDVVKEKLENYLSDALSDIGVTLDQLKEARDAVKEAHISDLLDRGIIKQEQLDLREAREALKGYISQQTLMADAAEILGIEIPELDEESGQRMDPRELMAILEEDGLTMLDLREAMHTAYQDAIANAANEGVITSEQADLVLQADVFGINPMPFGHGCHGMGGFRGAGPRGGFSFQNRIPAPLGTSL